MKPAFKQPTKAELRRELDRRLRYDRLTRVLASIMLEKMKREREENDRRFDMA